MFSSVLCTPTFTSSESSREYSSTCGAGYTMKMDISFAYLGLTSKYKLKSTAAWPMAQALLLLSCLGSLVARGDADTSFAFHQFSDSSGSLSVLGDARIHIDDLALELTNTNAGRATYDYPVRVLSSSSQTSISFETTFIFSIECDTSFPQSYGGGLTFSISSENKTIGDAGGYLGLVQANPSSTIATSQEKFFALEFDTHQDAQFQDMNDNHVGVDSNSLISSQAKLAQSGATPVTLASGNHIQAYVSYNSLVHVLDVSISPYTNNDYVKPSAPLLSVPIDLSTLFNEYMYIGFSAATGNGTVRHKVWSWTFKTTTINSNGQAVASPPDSDYLAPSPSPGDYDSPGTSAGVRFVNFQIQFCLVGLLTALVVLTC